MTQAQQLLDCERCIFYLVDTEATSNQVQSSFIIALSMQKFPTSIGAQPKRSMGVRGKSSL